MGSSKGGKAPQIQQPASVGKLEQAGSEMLQQGAPLRQQLLEQVLGAWLGGGVPQAFTPLAQQRRSAISAEGARTREGARSRLERQGLLNSSYGNQALEGIDRDIANMLVASDTTDLERLLGLGPQLAWQGAGIGMQGLGAAASLGTDIASRNAQLQQNQMQMNQAASAQKNQMLAGIGSSVAGLGTMAVMPGLQTKIGGWMNKPSAPTSPGWH